MMRRFLAGLLALSLFASPVLAQTVILPPTQAFGTLSGGTTTTQTVNGVSLDTHVFTANGTLTVTGGNAYVEYFMCGGGGGAGYSNSSYSGGLGGPGGVRAGIMKLTPGSYSITIGTSGAAGTSGAQTGVTGGDTTGLGLTASGGGGGGGFATGTPANGLNGGNGGGGTSATSVAGTGGSSSPATTPPQGGAGAAGTTSQNVAAQGGSLRGTATTVGVGIIDYRGVLSDISGSWAGYADGGTQLASAQSAQPGNTCRGGGTYNLGVGQAGDSGFLAVRTLSTP